MRKQLLLRYSLGIVMAAAAALTIQSCAKLIALQRNHRDAVGRTCAVVSVRDINRPIYRLANTDFLWNYPYVRDVRFTSLLHWLDVNPESRTCLIALPLESRTDGVTGRWPETRGECCVNRAYYDALLADGSGFDGLGSSITLEETAPPDLKKSESSSGRAMDAVVVGIVEEEGAYASPELYGTYRIYATMDDVSCFFIDYNNATAASPNDTRMYQPAILQERLGIRLFCEDGEKLLYMDEDGKLYTEEELCARLSEAPANAGFTVEVELDSADRVDEFLRELRAYPLGNSQSVAARVETARETERTTGKVSYIHPLYQQLYEAGEGERWYIYGNRNHYLLRAAAQDTAPLDAEYRTERERLLIRAICPGAAFLAAAALLTLCCRKHKEADHV